ncbi:DUF1631 family protein [Aliikangiella sp. G2MR2-5]|uniref:DUF1631 family protein n=1 Tax=Aliikangiella sp. G2MR2-5 TaxID=2788943 RepID=UPI0018A8FED8|nr:DUF1631 family protein [Aliikangiella sp. G2MR2-5]
MSRQLRSLLKKNRALEEKMFYEPRGDGWRDQLITTKELSEALSALSSKIIENRDNELCVLRMLNDVDSIKGRPLPSYEKNALQSVEILFNYIREYSNFDQSYYHILNSLQLAFTRLSLNDLSFLDNPKHIAVKFLEQLMTLGHHFNQNAGKLTQFFIHAIELLIDRLANRETVTSQTFMMASKKLDEYFDGFDEKVNTNVAKILSDVEARSREAQADRFTDELIKSKTQGEEMPIFLLDFFENQLTGVLHQIISQHGVRSKQTQQLLTDMDTITWSITCPFGDPDYNGRYQADVGQAMKRVFQEFQSRNAVDQYVNDFFMELEKIHEKKLQGQRVDYDVMISADIFSDEEYENDELDPWLEPQSRSKFDLSRLEEDNWYHLEIDEQQVRSKLLLVSQLTKELLFINMSGELVLKASFDDVEFLSNSVKPTPIDEDIKYKHATKSLIRELTSRLEILKSEYQTFNEKQAEDRKAREKAEEASRIAVQKRFEEERALQLKQEQERHRKQAERQAEERLLEELDAKQRFFIKSVLRKLKPGATVAYQDDSGKWRELKLNLVSQTTQRHIFCDAKGAKQLESTRDEVEELIVGKRLKIVKEADNTLDPLASLVIDRRKKLSQM